MGKLKKWVDDQSEFIRLADGESFDGKYGGYSMVASRFDTEKFVIRYLFTIDEKEKKFDCGNKSLALGLDSVVVGTLVKVSRTGEQTKTKYAVEEIAGTEEVA